MNALNNLFVTIVVFLIMSYGTGLIIGGPDRANKMLAWEFKQLARFGRWLLKQVFQAIANIFGYLAKQCGTKKKTP